MTIFRLHFVYNVDANAAALVKDFVHRMVEPETYPCRLCDLTYGRFVKKPGWQLFLWSLPVPSAFHTRDRFLRKFPGLAQLEFPAVVGEIASGDFAVLICAEQFRGIGSLAELKEQVTALLATGVRA